MVGSTFAQRPACNGRQADGDERKVTHAFASATHASQSNSLPCQRELQALTGTHRLPTPRCSTRIRGHCSRAPCLTGCLRTHILRSLLVVSAQAISCGRRRMQASRCTFVRAATAQSRARCRVNYTRWCIIRHHKRCPVHALEARHRVSTHTRRP